jgi:hypothetical protein
MSIIAKLSFWFSLLFSCRVTDPEISENIIDSVEFQESRGVTTVRDNGYCVGLMQIDKRYSPVPARFLKIPLVNRIVGVRAIKYWKKAAKGDLHLGLAAYNCGYKGLDKKCGVGYANQVLSRKIRRKRENEEECSALTNLINFLIDNRKYLKKPLQTLK